MTVGTDGQMSLFDQDSWCGKTCREHSVPTAVKISESSLKKQRGSQMKLPLFLDLRKGSGQTQEPSWEMGGLLLGEYTMHSFGVYPKEENASRLSQILEDNPHPKYCLSAKACQGILRRAEKRGKELPLTLKEVLEHQSVLIEEPIACDVYNQTLNGSISPSLTAATGGSNTSVGKVIDVCRYVSAGFKFGNSAQARSIAYQNEVSPTLAGGEGGNQKPCVVCLNDQGGLQMDVSIDRTGTLRAQEHGHQPNHGYRQGETCGTITKDQNNGIRGDTPIIKKMQIVRRLTPLECERLQGFQDGWTLIGEPEEVEVKDYRYEYDENGDVVSKTQIGTHKEIEYFYIDAKGKKKKCSDSARYKALGNSIAVGYANNGSGFWMWLMKRISAHYERNATLGSLFDGIGGFPLAWEHYNGKGSAVWASEIEEFPIAVTKYHFPEES